MAPDVARSFDENVEAAMRRQHIPGVGIAVGVGGEVRYARGYGHRNLPDALTVDENTSFKIASVSKQFTAAALMLGVESRLVALDDPIRRFFPKLPFEGVCVADLLRHTSGIPGYSEVDDFDQRCRTSASPDEIIEIIGDLTPSFAPATNWEYSNSNYVLLARLLERIFDQSYRDVIRDRLARPAGLGATDVDDLATLRAGRAEGYARFALGDFERANPWNPSWEYGTGGLVSTAADLVRWNAALRSGRIVDAASFQQMGTPFILPDGRSTNYGFGLVVHDIDDLRELRHQGGLPGFSLENASYPDVDVDIVVLTNIDTVFTYFSITRPILAAALERSDLIVPVQTTPNRPVSNGIREPDVRHHIAALQRGDVDGLRPSRSMQRTLTPSHRSQLESLREFGPIREVQLMDWFRRPPRTFFGYDVLFAEERLVVAFGHSDDNHISAIYVAEFPEVPLRP